MGPRLRFQPPPPLLGVVGAASLQSAGLALEPPSPGVVCDEHQCIAYDSQGPFLSQTRRLDRQKAERELPRQISGRPLAQDVWLNDGEVSSINHRTCRDGGWQRRHGAGGGGQLPAASSCPLLQRGRPVFSGGCPLRRRQSFSDSAHVAVSRDGRRSNFYNQDHGQLVLRKAHGIRFRCSDLQLEPSRGPENEHRIAVGSGNLGGNPNRASSSNGRSGPQQHTAPTTTAALEGLLHSLSH